MLERQCVPKSGGKSETETSLVQAGLGMSICEIMHRAGKPKLTTHRLYYAL